MGLIKRGSLVLGTIGALVFLALIPLTAGNSTNTVARRRAVGPGTPDTLTAASFPANLKEHYLSDDGIAYVRPGLKVKINSVTIGSDRKPVIDFSLTDSVDQPVDRLGKTTPGAITPNFVLAWYNPDTRQYTSYTTRTQTSAATSPHPNVTAIQAGADSGGMTVDFETGHAKYTFKTVLPANFDQTKTTTLGVYATRNLTDIVGKNYFANVEYDFRPDGGTVTDKWDKLNQAASCNNCHNGVNQLAAHGGSRQDVKLCALCHQPQTIDPDTGNTVDFKVLIHKIHDGENLPSVKAGTPYVIIGNANSVNDFSTVAFPQDIRNCVFCHEGTNAAAKPAQNDVWATKPSRAACSSCHDNINFATGANHPGGIQADDGACVSCHIADSAKEFDASVKGAHVIEVNSKQLKGLTAAVTSVTDLAPGKKPTVVFTIKNADDNTAVDGSKLSAFAPMFGGNTGNYTQYFRESAVGKATFDATKGTTTYTFTAAVPADASGTWTVSADVYRSSTLKRADGQADITGIRDAAVNPIKYVALTGTATPRRTSVSIALCNNCHANLALHGGQRKNIEECVICHNPVEGDQSFRPANAGAKEAISFQRLIHRIHTGDNLTQDFTIYGFGGSKNNFNEVRFPGEIKDCSKCHVNTAAFSLPVATSAGPVTTLRDYFTPQGPGTAACLGCHDNKDAAAHAFLNTTTFPGSTNPAEACATCHGTGKDWDAAKVHAQ
jgi:OmcA/MtrC family decaheme c-type cytochrome